MSRSLLDQFIQIRSSVKPLDDLTMALAETTGRLKNSGLVVTVSGSAVTVTSGTTFTADDEGNFIVISGTAYEISNYTNSTTVTVAGSPSSGGGLNADLHYYKNLEDDLNYIRSQLKEIGNNNNWYEPSNISGTGSGTTHTHYELDLDYQGSDVWSKTNASIENLDTDNMDVYLNGLLNRDHSDYFTATVSGTTLTVTFAYTTDIDMWTHVKFFKYEST